jgi:hypothetical protein
MKMTPEIATMRIQRELAALEETLAEALEKAAGLTSTLARARTDTAAGLTTGHDVMMRMTSIQSGLLKVGAETGRVHQGLLKVGVELGYCDELCLGAATVQEVSKAA